MRKMSFSRMALTEPTMMPMAPKANRTLCTPLS